MVLVLIGLGLVVSGLGLGLGLAFFGLGLGLGLELCGLVITSLGVEHGARFVVFSGQSRFRRLLKAYLFD